MSEWVCELWYIHTVDHCSVPNRNEVSSYERIKGKFKYILPSIKANKKWLYTVYILERQNYGASKAIQ